MTNSIKKMIGLLLVFLGFIFIMFASTNIIGSVIHNTDMASESFFYPGILVVLLGLIVLAIALRERPDRNRRDDTETSAFGRILQSHAHIRRESVYDQADEHRLGYNNVERDQHFAYGDNRVITTEFKFYNKQNNPLKISISHKKNKVTAYGIDEDYVQEGYSGQAYTLKQLQAKLASQKKINKNQRTRLVRKRKQLERIGNSGFPQAKKATRPFIKAIDDFLRKEKDFD